jgi:hypothetical protein
MIRYLLKRSPIFPFSRIRLLSTNIEVNEEPRLSQEELKENERVMSKLYEHIPKIGLKYLRGLRFKKFIGKMEQLYLKECKWQKDNVKRAKEFMIASVASTTPIHDAFRHYFKRSSNEYAARNIVMCLKSIENILKVRGPTNPSHYFDYSQEQMLESWQLVHVIEDIQFALKLTSIIIPYDIYRVLFTNT